jgi:N-acetylglucosamine-6-sulfatase
MALVALAAPAVAAAVIAPGPERFAGAAVKARPALQARPNIVVLQTDDQRADSMRVMANVHRLLAAQGTTFANSYASYPLCCPSRATFFTGQYAHNHGVLGNNLPRGGFEKFRGANSLPVWLRRAGYHTALIGKYLNGYGERNARELPPGWSDWNGAVGSSTYDYFKTTLNRNGTLVTTGTDPASYQTDVYARLASDVIRRRAPSAQPFFLYVGFLAPHNAVGESSEAAGLGRMPVPAPRHHGRFASARLPSWPSLNEADVSDKPKQVRELPRLTSPQLAEIAQNHRLGLASLLAVDEAVARVVAALRSTGELGRTLIIFTSDNGYLHGEHRLPGGKSVLYEPSARVPLVMRGPGIRRGAIRRQVVANVDLAPTILRVARASAGLRQDGGSLLALAASAGAQRSRRVLLEGNLGGNPNKRYAAIRTPRYVYAEYANGERELYDLVRDPFELRNLGRDPARSGLRSALSRQLAALRSCRGAACVRASASG